jgi:hypothetical protein
MQIFYTYNLTKMVREKGIYTLLHINLNQYQYIVIIYGKI